MVHITGRVLVALRRLTGPTLLVVGAGLRLRLRLALPLPESEEL